MGSNTSGAAAVETFEITGITGTFKDTTAGFSGNITGLYGPISYVTPATGTSASPVAYTPSTSTATPGLSYDDLFFPLGNSPDDCPGYPFSGGDFDSLGVAFNVAGTDGKAYIGEFFSNGALPNAGILMAAADANANGIVDDPNALTETAPEGVVGGFVATAPEPSTVLQVGGGLAGLLAMRRRKHARNS